MSQNAIWDFFVKGQTVASKARCTTCGKDFSLGSDKPKLQTVTGLKNHLAKQHKDVNAEYQRMFRFRPKVVYKFGLSFGFGRNCITTFGPVSVSDEFITISSGRSLVYSLETKVE